MEISPIDAPQIPAHFHLKLRQRFYQLFRKQENQNQKFFSSVCLFKGITDLPKNYEDTNHYVEQQSTFWYLLGVKETGCYAVLNNNDESVVLFIPRFAEIYKMWMYVKPLEKFKSDYQVQKVLYVDELQQYLKDQKPSQIYLFAGIDSDSKLQVPQPEQIYTRHAEVINTKTLWPLISNLRAIKTEDEIQLMKYVCRLTTEAHIKVMKSAKPGLKQIQMHSLFHFDHSIHSGCLDIGFPSICSSGQDCATLHYIENDKIMQPGQMLLHDMGGKWYGYCADQAITFPIDGKFTEKQKKIYNAVYEAQKMVLQTLKAGVNWQDMHLLAEKVILEHLIAIGIINKFDIKKLQEKRVGAVFFPHGLGHFLGLRVHDLGGYTSGPKRSEKAGLKNLRTLRDMEQGMIITVEPGCYFIDFIIRNALQDPEMNKYLNEDKINQYREIGGVRLEDNVVVRKDGIEMLSSLPRKWQEVEKLLVDKLK